MFFCENCFSFDNHIVTFDGNNFTCIFINKIFKPGTNYPCGKFSSQYPFQAGFAYFYFFGQVEYF